MAATVFPDATPTLRTPQCIGNEKSMRDFLGRMSSNVNFIVGAALQNVVEDTTPQLGGDLDTQGNDILNASELEFNEQADHGVVPAAGNGIVWVRNDAPNVLVFTDDAGTDHLIGSASASDLVNDTTPQLGGNLDTNSFTIGFDDDHGITDSNGNEQLWFQETASAVNYAELTNAATGNAVTFTAVGDDTNVGLTIDSQGGGSTVTIGGTGSVTLANTVNVSDGFNFVLGTTTGTSIGSTTSQKVSVYGVTPVIQASAIAAVSSADLTGSDTVDQVQLEAEIAALVTAVNDIRTALANFGITA